MDSYYLNRDADIDFSYVMFKALLAKVAKLPLERVIGECMFKEHTFRVYKDVFIPRWETEGLVDIACKLIEGEREPISLIDICSGTGVIGISVMLRCREKISKLVCLDISKRACRNIECNLKRLKVEGSVINDEWLHHLRQAEYQMILANFPYVGEEDPIDDGLTQIEPKLALFGKDEGWEHYGRLIEYLEVNSHWRYVVLECSEYHLERWKSIKEDKAQWVIELYEDLNGKFRFVSIRRL